MSQNIHCATSYLYIFVMLCRFDSARCRPVLFNFYFIFLLIPAHLLHIVLAGLAVRFILRILYYYAY